MSCVCNMTIIRTASRTTRTCTHTCIVHRLEHASAMSRRITASHDERTPRGDVHEFVFLQRHTCTTCMLVTLLPRAPFVSAYHVCVRSQPLTWCAACRALCIHLIVGELGAMFLCKTLELIHQRIILQQIIYTHTAHVSTCENQWWSCSSYRVLASAIFDHVAQCGVVCAV